MSDADLFINQIAPIIQKYAKKNGYKSCSGIIAQACCESGNGKSLLSKKYHNYFGMKCGSRWKGYSVNMRTKEEYTQGTLTTIRDNFRAYETMEDGVKGYFDFTKMKRYSNLKDAKDYKEFARLVKEDGWATSSRYTSTLINIAERNNLQRFDFEAPGEEPAKDADYYIVGHNYKLQFEMKVRTGAGKEYPPKVYRQLTKGGQRHDSDRDGALNKGTVVTCKEIVKKGKETWMKVPSGWICARDGEKVYIA